MNIYKSKFEVIAPDIVSRCNQLFEEDNYEATINLIQQFVLKIFRLPEFHNKALFLKELDVMQVKLSAKLNKINKKNKNIINEINIIIGTEFYMVGGHTRVSRDFANLNENTIIVVTDVYGRCVENHNYFRYFKDQFPYAFVILLPPGTLLEKTKYLIQFLENIRPKTVLIMTHHDDPIGNIALACSEVPNKIYYHHCDHNPALGATIKQFKHYDTNPYVESICKENVNSKYLPLMYESNEGCDFIFNENEEFNIICAGTSIKFNLTDDLSDDYYPKIICEIIRETSYDFHHVGSLNEIELNKIIELLKRYEINSEKFKYIGPIPNIPEFINSINNPIYLTSFPLPGGMMLIEVLSVGVPIIEYTKKNKSVSELMLSDLAFKTLTPSTVLRFSSIEEFKENLNEIKNNYMEILNKNKIFFKINHSKKAISGLMNEIIK